MRLLRRISAFICVILVLAVGILLSITAVVNMTETEFKIRYDTTLNRYLDDLSVNQQIQIATFLIGLLLLLVGCITIYLAIEDIHSSGRIKLESAGGRLTVSVSAIEDYVGRLGRSIEGVKELRPRLRRTPTGWSLHARVTVFSDQNVKDINENIRNEIRQGIVRIIGEHSIEPIDIHVSKITDRGRVGSRRSMDVEFTS